jgi:hypothetical protein
MQSIRYYGKDALEMWELVKEWIGRLSPIAINALIGHWVYASIQQHDYAKVAGWIVFILFYECDRIKSKIDHQTDRIHALHERVRKCSAYPAVSSRCRRVTRRQPTEANRETYES